MKCIGYSAHAPWVAIIVTLHSQFNGINVTVDKCCLSYVDSEGIQTVYGYSTSWFSKPLLTIPYVNLTPLTWIQNLGRLPVKINVKSWLWKHRIFMWEGKENFLGRIYYEDFAKFSFMFANFKRHCRSPLWPERSTSVLILCSADCNALHVLVPLNLAPMHVKWTLLHHSYFMQMGNKRQKPVSWPSSPR